jgi:hypothetical protein
MSRAHNDLPKNLVNRLLLYRNVLSTQLDPTLTTGPLGDGMTPVAYVAQIDDFMAACAVVQKTQQAFQNALIARTGKVPKMLALADRAKAFIRSSLGPDHPLVDQQFLRGPGGRHEIPAETKVAAVEKRRQTRKRRKTMGKRQRQKLKAQ